MGSRMRRLVAPAFSPALAPAIDDRPSPALLLASAQLAMGTAHDMTGNIFTWTCAVAIVLQNVNMRA